MHEFLDHFLKEFTMPLKNPVLIFSLILFIILLSPILLKKLKIPGIIGLIISGVVIGPHGLNILAHNSAVNLFSTIGLLYIMFIAGLELDLNEFRANRNKSLVFGFFTFIIPLGIGYPVCHYLLGYEVIPSLLTASMFATHTLVAYPIVSRLGISKNIAVAVAVGGTILTDTAVLIILAVVVGHSAGSLDQEFFIRLGISLTLFSLFMFLVVPRIAKWFFQKLESEKHAHYIFVLSIVFFAAFLAHVAGVEPIIGAFVAGLALNKLIPHTSALMNRIEFIGNALFIPFFLISVGMLVDMSVVLKGPMALIVAATLTAVALAGKWLAAFFTSLVFKFNRTQRRLIFGLSSAHAAATLAVILVGYNAKILDENILNGTIILILITCIAASLVTERAARKTVLAEDSADSNGKVVQELSNEHILIATARVDKMDNLLEFAALIKDKKSANPISILTVVPNNEEAELNIVKARFKLESYVKQASASETKVNVITTIDHNAAGGIARISREIMADIIILGWPQKSGFLDKIFGEKADHIISNTSKNLFITDFRKALVVTKRIVIISPPLSEREKGFDRWLEKITLLSGLLSIPIVYYGNSRTHDAIDKHLKKTGTKLKILPRSLPDLDELLILARDINDDDLLVMTLARKGSISYSSELDSIPAKLEKHFTGNNKILIYPRQFEQTHTGEGMDELYSGTITKGIETIGKGIESIFKKPKESPGKAGNTD